MKKTSRYCSNCDNNTTHVLAGLMPQMFTRGETSSAWDSVSICTECGSMGFEAVRDEQIQQAHQRYLDILVENDIMTEEEIEQEGIQRRK